MNKRVVGTVLAVLSVLSGCGDSQSDAAVATSARQTRQVAAVAPTSVSIQGYRANYTIVKNTDGTALLTNLSDHSSQQLAATILTIKFVDAFVSFDSAGIPGASYRLYQAAFNRQPDLGGLGYWTHVLQAGAPLDVVAANFTASAEFQKAYGQLSDNQFITLLYHNVLGRLPDQGGYDYWALQMTNGMSRASVLASFSESAENKANVAAAIQNGIAYTPDAADLSVRMVQKSSYENKAAAAAALGPQDLPPEAKYGNAYAFADFFQDGSFALVTHSLIYNRDDPSTANQFGAIRFYKQVNGAWVDNTSALLTDTSGCIHPRKAVVADFNGDGRPDVFFACHGFDAAPFAGEVPHILLSQADGTYKNVTLPDNCYCHGASAADASGKGFADVLVTDNQTNEKVPYFLINNRNGTRDVTFTRDLTRLPFKPNVYLAPNTNYGAVVMYDAELIDFDAAGKYDAFLAGTEAPDDESGIAPTIFKNDGSGHYGNPVTLPTDPVYRTTLDIVYAGGAIYLNRVQTNGGAYNFSSIQKIDYKTLAATRIYNNTANFPTGSTWLDWIIPFQGKIVSQNAAYGVAVAQ